MPRHLAAFLPSFRAIDRLRITRPELFANQAQYPRINDPVPDKLHQPFMVDGIERVSQIRIHDPLRTNLDSSPHFARGVLSRSPSPIAKAGIIEYRLEDRSNRLSNACQHTRSSIGGIPRLGGKSKHAIRYYIASLKPSAAWLNAAIRHHWGIENKIHWILDLAFLEDLSRKRAGPASESGIIFDISVC